MFKLDLEKAEERDIKLPTPLDHRKRKGIPEKNLLLLHWLCWSLWQCRSQKTEENSLRDGNTRSPSLPPEKPACGSRSNSYNQTWNNKLVQNWERSTSRPYTVTLLIHLICRVYCVKCQAGWITSWNKDCQKKNQQPQICRWYHPYGRKWRGTKEPLDENERLKKLA